MESISCQEMKSFLRQNDLKTAESALRVQTFYIYFRCGFVHVFGHVQLFPMEPSHCYKANHITLQSHKPLALVFTQDKEYRHVTHFCTLISFWNIYKFPLSLNHYIRPIKSLDNLLCTYLVLRSDSAVYVGFVVNQITLR
jgi:hypothetical protein